MLSRFLLTTALLAALIIPGATTSAQVATSPTQPTDTAFARQVRAMESLALAHRLSVYGQRERRPLALMAAAEILIEHPTRPLAPPPTDLDTAGAVLPDAVRLLASARAFAGDDQRLLALITPLDRRARSIDRGSLRGPRQLYGRVASSTRREHLIEFRGGEPAVVYVSGDGDSDLDVFVYDESGQVVASATGPRDECVARWQPQRQGRFRVEVRNLGSAPNWYWMATN